MIDMVETIVENSEMTEIERGRGGHMIPDIMNVITEIESVSMTEGHHQLVILPTEIETTEMLTEDQHTPLSVVVLRNVEDTLTGTNLIKFIILLFYYFLLFV